MTEETAKVKSEPTSEHSIPGIKSDPDQNEDINNMGGSRSGSESESESDSSDSEEGFYKPPEPLYDKVNSLSFRSLCQRFETMWKQKKQSKKKKPSKEQLLGYLLPASLKKFLTANDVNVNGSANANANANENENENVQPKKEQSIFPMLRLIAPDKDTTRPRLWMKEKTIATTWAEALGLSKQGSDYKKLVNFTNPVHAGASCGDISNCVYDVVKKRFPELESKGKSTGSGSGGGGGGGVTIGEMNELFDELAGIRKDNRPANSNGGDWNGGAAASLVNTTSNSRLSKKQRETWVSKLISMKFSPIEHKWIVRILLQRMDFGVGSDSIIGFYHPFAEDLYSANKNLKTLCATLCDREFLKQRKRLMQQERNAVDDHNRAQYLPKHNEPAVLNHTIDPMLSLRTSFEMILTDLQKRHKAYADVLEKDDPIRSCLALKHPAFTCEVKLDGERLISHMKKGIVKVQTRNGKWYSNLYSPVLGPVIRKAVGEYNVEIILDGEVVAWDDSKKETIPFGDNRRVAKVRQQWLRKKGELDPRDFNLHDEDADVDVVHQAMFNSFDKNQTDYENRRNVGSDVWLKYVIFDILYLGGEDAGKVITDAFSFMKTEDRPVLKRPGSILHFDLMKRRRILETLIHPQENAIETVETIVVTSDGKLVDGQEYFSSSSGALQYGHSPLVLDSINFTLDQLVPDIMDVDSKRREGKTDKMIGELRARALDKFYGNIVTRRQLEGLIFKDLSSPYCFGARYRKLGYWYKLKDDYSRRGHAADIDVVLIGAQFATGSRNAGCLNSFLVACKDDGLVNEGTKYMTLGKCNGNVVSDKTLRKMLDTTGYSIDESGKVTYGSWFKSSEVPDFLSRRTFQHSSNPSNGGWKPDKKDRPDLWIHPEDSFVLTLHAGEITDSKQYSAGVTLRFPRINKIRADGFDGDPKAASEVETVSVLHDIYFTRRAQQETAERELQNSQNSQTIMEENRVFYTLEQASNKVVTKKKRIMNAPKVRAPKIKESLPFESDIFKDKNFTVLDGTYRLEKHGLDADDAKTTGWFDLAKSVRNQQHIVDFIIKHGGNCSITANQDTDYIIGGRLSDPRVASYRKSIEDVDPDVLTDKTKRAQHLRKIHEIGGIVKWTFLFSTVHRLHSGVETSKVIPRRHDYIIMSKFAEKSLLGSEDMYGLHLYDDTNIVEFKRALLEVERQEKVDKKEAHQHHNKRAKLNHSVEVHYESFTADEENMLLTSRQRKFLPNGGNEPMILYPDFFQLGEFGSDLLTNAKRNVDIYSAQGRWKDVPEDCTFGEVASSLLLALVGGAYVTDNLHRNVTHILCDLKREQTAKWHSDISVEVFGDPKRGLFLHQALLKIEDKLMNTKALNVTLVSPAWIRNRF